MNALRWVSLLLGCVFAVGAVASFLTFRAFAPEGWEEVRPDAILSGLFACLSVLGFGAAWALRKSHR